MQKSAFVEWLLTGSNYNKWKLYSKQRQGHYCKIIVIVKQTALRSATRSWHLPRIHFSNETITSDVSLHQTNCVKVFLFFFYVIRFCRTYCTSPLINLCLLWSNDVNCGRLKREREEMTSQSPLLVCAVLLSYTVILVSVFILYIIYVQYYWAVR